MSEKQLKRFYRHIEKFDLRIPCDRLDFRKLREEIETMSTPTCDNDCIAYGYTRELMAYAGPCDLHISAKPDADLDGTFLAFDHDEQGMIRVNGWLFSFEEIK